MVEAPNDLFANMLVLDEVANNESIQGHTRIRCTTSTVGIKSRLLLKQKKTK